MNITLNKTTKYILALIMGLSIIFSSFSFIQPQKTIGEMNIGVDANGQLVLEGAGMEYDDSASAMSAFLEKYRTLVVGISGVGAISMIAFFIFNFLKLGSVATNPSERAKVLTGLIWSGLAAAGLGAVSLIVGFFYNSLK